MKYALVTGTDHGVGLELARELLQVINVNAVGTLRVTNALSKLVMMSDLKMIVNISSEAGSIQDCFRQGWFGYGMSKAANNMQPSKYVRFC